MPKQNTKKTAPKPKKRLKLISYRLEHKLTQEQVAAHFKVHYTTILRHESGQAELSADWLQKYAKLYGCSPNDLLEEGDIEAMPSAALYGWLMSDCRVEFPAKEETVLLGLRVPAAKLEIVQAKEDVFPFIRKGDMLAFDAGKQFTPKLCLGRLCLVVINRNASAVGVFKRGSKPNHYTITPLTGAPLDDKMVHAAYPIKHILKD